MQAVYLSLFLVLFNMLFNFGISWRTEKQPGVILDAHGAIAAPYFLPPYEWYNSQITQWTRALGLRLVNFSPGTRSTAYYTYPEMGSRYVSSDVIYQSVLDCEERMRTV